MSQHTQPDLDAIIAGFRSKLDEYTKLAADGRPYVLVDRLQKWLRRPRTTGHKHTNVDYLLHVAYHNRTKPDLPIAPEDLAPGHDDCCLLVFSILLTIGCGEKIHLFALQAKVDRQLPLLWDTVQSMFDGGPLATKFFKEQWRFCPAKFELHKSREYGKNWVIPICRKMPIKEGGTSHLWHIDVQEEFVSPRLRKAAASSRFNFASDGEPEDWRYEFALKTFKEGNRRLYNNEKDALRGLKQHDGMVRWLGDFSHEDARRSSHPPRVNGEPESEESGTTTHNILLEFGEMDLEVLFGELLPPLLPKEIEDFWASFFEVAEAVEGVHHLKTGDGVWARDFHGWHSDIKPDNILKIGEKYKLADPGFARFQQVNADGPLQPEQVILGGTETYGPPEIHPGTSKCRLPLPQAIDIWSLGCVLSDVATWVVLGYQGVKQFRHVRQKRIRDLLRSQQNGSSRRLSAQGLSEGDYFHDGNKVLDCVKQWHEYLRKVLRPTDTITTRVLDLVDNRMLLAGGADRIESRELCQTLTQILKLSQAEHHVKIPGIVHDALLEIDLEALSSAENQKRSEPVNPPSLHLAVPNNVEARKSKLLQTPLMTTSHRKSALLGRGSISAVHIPESDVSRSTTESPQEDRSLFVPPRTSPLPKLAGLGDPFQNNQATAAQRMPMHKRVSSGESQQSPTTRALRPQSQRKHQSQNMFQACEELDRLEAGIVPKVGNYMGRVKKDKILAQHFRDRDIKFLVDNGASMAENWYEATFLLRTLVRKAKGLDPDGMELIFTAGSVEVKGKKNKDKPHKFVDAMRSARPRADVNTNLKERLGDIFNDYNKAANKSLQASDGIKRMTLIIFTDGIWAGMRNKNDVDENIIRFVRDLESKVQDYRQRPFSIQFVQFGRDLDAMYKLESLDRDLKWKGIPDIIDTEPSWGDVYKMMLGSFVEEYDFEGEETEEEEEPAGSQSLDSQIMPLKPVSRAATEASVSTQNNTSHRQNSLYDAQVNLQRHGTFRQPPTLQEPPRFEASGPAA